MPDSTFAQFGNQKYISLETFRRNGLAVAAPVWFVLHDRSLYVYTEAQAGKVKRIRNNPHVRVALCTIRGRVIGPWMDGTASLVEGGEERTADTLLDRKYPLKPIFRWFSRIRQRERAMIKIQP